MVGSLSIITYAHRRQLQVEKFLPYHLAALRPRDELVLVDYGDPCHCGEFAAAISDDHLTVVRVSGVEWFHMDHARNLGGRAARGDVAVFADVDFLLTPGVFNECLTLQPGEFLVQHPKTHSFGFICCWRQDYLDAQGYEEAVCGYGYDDTQFNQLLSTRGLGRRLMVNQVEDIGVGSNTRNLQPRDLGKNAAVNMRVLRALRMLDSKHNNCSRNWGWGGQLLKQSALAREEKQNGNDASTGEQRRGTKGAYSEVAEQLHGG